MNRIKRVSCFFRVLFQITFVLLPLPGIVYWVVAPVGTSWLYGGIHLSVTGIGITHPLSVTSQMLGGLVGLMGDVPSLFVLYFLIRLFRLYERNEIFTMGNVIYLRNIGYALLIGLPVSVLCEALTSLLLTWGNSPGSREVQFGVQGHDVVILLTGLLVILVSWIMAEGCKLREEQSLII